MTGPDTDDDAVIEAFDACERVLEGLDDIGREAVLALVMGDYLARYSPYIRNAIFAGLERNMRLVLTEHPQAVREAARTPGTQGY